MLHFGGSPVRGVGPGNPILSDSQREPPPSTFNYGWDIAISAGATLVAFLGRDAIKKGSDKED
jgi:hypothetical protein